MSPIKLSPLFKAFIAGLNSAGIEYLLVGGYAVQYHAYPRLARDLDLWTSTRRENAEKLSRVVSSWTGNDSQFPPELFEHTNRIIRFCFPSVKVEIVDPIPGQKPRTLRQFQAEFTEQIEILTVQTGVEFAACFTNSELVEIDGIEVRIIGKQDLIKIKQAGKRLKDVKDLDALG